MALSAYIRKKGKDMQDLSFYPKKQKSNKQKVQIKTKVEERK